MSPFVRILLRYGSGLLIAKGLLDDETGNMLVADPDVAQTIELALGAGMGAASEVWFMLAKRYGWTT
jgi:hypothetical protein